MRKMINSHFSGKTKEGFSGFLKMNKTERSRTLVPTDKYDIFHKRSSIGQIIVKKAIPKAVLYTNTSRICFEPIKML